MSNETQRCKEMSQRFYELGNGRKVVIKKLGAFSQAKVIERVFSLASGIQIDTIGTGNAEQLVKLLTKILGTEFNKAAELITWISDLTIKELQADGDDAITLDELMGIFEASLDLNQSQKLMQQIKNGDTPTVPAAGEDYPVHPIDRSQLNSFTHSQQPTDGVSATLNKYL